MRVGLRWALIGVVAALLAVQCSYAQSPDYTLDEYTQLLREAFAAAQRNDEIGLRDAASRLTPIRSVAAPDGSALPVDLTWLNEELASTSINMRVIRERLGAQVEVVSNARTYTDDTLTNLDQILSNPPYNNPKNELPPSSSPVGESWLGRMLNFFFGDANIMTGCLTVLAILVLGSVAVYILLAVRSGVRQQVRPRSADDAEELNLTSTQAVQRADEVAFEGDFRKAVRYLYLSTLLWLEERGALRYDRTLTNREVLAAIPANSALRNRLTPVVQTFDRVWYGFKAIDQAAFDAYRQQVTTLREGR